MKLLNSSKKGAITLSYISLVVQAFSTMFITNFYLREFGADQYGLYQMINGMAQYILILDLGISTVMVRYLSEFNAENDRKRAENFAFHFGIVVLVVCGVIVLAGSVINANIENIYTKLSPEEYALSHRMFSLMIVQLVLTVVNHYFQGISFAHDQYFFERTVSLIKIFLDFVVAIVLAKLGLGIFSIVLTNISMILLHTMASVYYALFVVKFRIRYHYPDLGLLKPAFLLMLAMLLQSIVGYVNSSVDKTILGIMMTKTDVTVYSIAASLVTMFNTLPTTISSVFQPEAVRLVVKKSTPEEMTDFVVRPGRIQFMLAGGFLAGFVLMGTDFIICWTGVETIDSWLYVLLILIPNMIPLVQNICIAILNALDKRIYRSIILSGMTLVNVGLTVLLVHYMGAIGAPLATGISYLIGHGFLMNLYYQRKLKLNIRRMFSGITKNTRMAVFVSFIINVPLVFIRDDGNWLLFIGKALVFCAVYLAALILFGFNNDEKKMFNSFLKKMKLSKFELKIDK